MTEPGTLDLFDCPAPPHQRHSGTSRAAAVAIEPKAGTMRRTVLEYLRAKGHRGATDLQMQADLRMDPSTQRPRRVELVRAGLVRDSGETRETPSGRKATVWKVCAGIYEVCP